MGLFVLFAIAFALLLALLTIVLMRDMVRPPRHTAGYAVARGLAVDPGELGLNFENWMLETPDGAELPVWEIRTGRIENSLTGVFVHGWGHSRIDSLARIKPFVDVFDRIVLYDLRGHGDATGRSRLGHDEHLDLLLLLEKLGESRFVLIGHSMGSVIAINAVVRAARDQERLSSRITGIIAYGPYCEFRRSLQGRLKVAGLPHRPVTDLALLAHRVIGLRPACLSEHDVRDLPCPLMVFHGVNDVVAPLDHSRRIIGAAPSATLHEIADAAHVDAHLVDTEKHDALVREFIQARSPGIAMPGIR